MEQMDIESQRENEEDNMENENIHDWEQDDAEKEANHNDNATRTSDTVVYDFQRYAFSLIVVVLCYKLLD